MPAFSEFNGPKISVIVPVYNVEKYIGTCLESLRKQSYKNYEVIVVDDGSTDNTAEICENVAQKDKRFRICYKKNGGVSSARNYGLNNVTGEYICFVDSDDYVSTHMLYILMLTICRTGLSMASVSDVIMFQDGKATPKLLEVVSTEKIESSVQILSEEQMQLELLHQKLNCGVQGKLFDREILKKIESTPLFPEGKVYEDLAGVYKLVHAAGKSAIVTLPLYAYRRRSTGIMRTKNSEIKIESSIEIARQLRTDMRKMYPQYITAIDARCFALLRRVYIELESKQQKKVIWQEIIRYRYNAFRDVGSRKMSRAVALYAMIGRLPFNLYCFIFRIYLKLTW